MEIIRQTAVATYAVVPLIDAVSRPSYKASPTLAAGDVKIIRHTGGAWNVANIGTLPAIVDASATKQILVTLTATEMTSDNLDYPIIVQFIDQTATKEWDDQEIVIWSKQVPANAVQILGTAVSTPATAGILDVNLKNIANAAVSTSSAQLGVNSVQAGGVAWASGSLTDAVFAAATYPKALFTGTATAGDAGTITLPAGASATANIYKGCSIKIVGGTGAGQSRTIIYYTTGRVAYVDAIWAVSPANDSVVVINTGKLTLDVTATGIAAAGGASTITLDTNAVATADYYNGSCIQIISGTGAGQSRIISAYTVGRLATVSYAWGTQPDNTSVYAVKGSGDVILGGANSAGSTALSTAAAGGILVTPANKLATSASNAASANLTEINSLSPAAVQLGKSAATIVSATVDIIDFAPTVTEFETATIVSPAADFYKGRTAIFTTGTLTNQAREIVASSFNAGTGKTHITVKALTAAPAAGVGFNIV